MGSIVMHPCVFVAVPVKEGASPAGGLLLAPVRGGRFVVGQSHFFSMPWKGSGLGILPHAATCSQCTQVPMRLGSYCSCYFARYAARCFLHCRQPTAANWPSSVM